jgi:hypothetical protein
VSPPYESLPIQSTKELMTFFWGENQRMYCRISGKSFPYKGWNVWKEQMIREQLRIHGQDWQGPSGQVTPGTTQHFSPSIKQPEDYLERPPLFFSHYFLSMWTIYILYILFGSIWKGVLVGVDRSTSSAIVKSFFHRMIPAPPIPHRTAADMHLWIGGGGGGDQEWMPFR